MARFGRTRPALPGVPWACAMAMALALASVVPVTDGKGDEAASTGNVPTVSGITATSPASSVNVTLLCRSTPYPRACETALTSVEARSARDPFAASVQFAMARATTARVLAQNLSASASASAAPPAPAPSGMHDCAVLLGISLAQLRDALAGSAADADGTTTWLSAALTNQDTCRESLADVPLPDDPAGSDAVRRQVAALARFISTALALHVGKVNKGGSGGAPSTVARDDTAFPSWLSEHDRRLLESPSPATNDDDIVVTPDAVVALDGSGTHTSINEAIAAVTAGVSTEACAGRGAGLSRRRRRRKVIHVKAGRYEESVSISYQQANVMLVGDGKGKTIIDGDKSVAGGYTTWSSATVAAMGAGFIAKGVSILNSAGPGQGQAVALLVSGDRSVVYQCEVKGHQDTLFAHSNRQFYADTDISGTVDFISGNAAAVLQRCNIQARRPRPGQQDVVTAQGRADPNQNTGFSIHRCRVTGAPDLGGDTPVYLGRPWRRYARVAVMATVLDGSVAPAGWLQWSGQPAPATLYYGEYRNTGAGAATAGRVAWSGVHTSMSMEDATGFTVANFIMGDSWLDATGVKYTSGL